MSQRYIGGVVTETTNVAQAPWTGSWTQQAALQGFAGAQAPLRIANSLRFRSSASAYLNRTPSVAGNRQTWTWSGWVKRGLLASAGLFQSSGAGGFGVDGSIGFASDTVDFIFDYNAGSRWRLTTTQVLRDPSAWYHLIIVADTTNATSTDRLRLYINGNRVTAFSTANYPTLNANGTLNQAYLHNIGYSPSVAYFDGYLTEINFIDGQALTPSSFGQYDANGVWQPKAYTGTYGTNGFRLNFSNGTSTTTLGYDSSGNSNNWTTNNISLTAGSTYDWMIDSPTPYPGSSYGVGNYCVLNPLQTGSYVTESNANLTITGNAATNSALALSSIANLISGKWYWEYTQGTVNSEVCGVMTTNMAGISLLNGEGTTNSYGVGARASGDVYGAEKTVSTITSWTAGDVIGLALDCDNGAIYWSKNGTWLNSGVPTSGASKTGAVGAWTPSATKVITPSFGAYNGGSVNATFGQRPFAYTPPSGYKTLCTQNLPVVTIYNGAQYMAATTYTGNGSTQSIVNTVNGISFQPDFVWIKERSSACNHALYDSVRGNTKVLSSDVTVAEYTQSPTAGLASFNSAGFSVTYPNTGDYYVNRSSQTYIGWNWKAGGTAVTNTAGSITSSVSANATAGFSVVTYTGNGSAGATVGHGLGVAPSFIITKTRSSVMDWYVYHVSLGVSQYLALNSTIAAGAATNYWGSSSTTFALSAGGNNVNGSTMVAYCFAAIAGYSAFGSYTGNGSSDGPFVYCGFRPRFVLIKRTDSTDNWIVQDTARSAYNLQMARLFPNLSAAEATDAYDGIDFLSNGFKLRYATAGSNASGGTYIYAAFAENPFQNSLAR